MSDLMVLAFKSGDELNSPRRLQTAGSALRLSSAAGSMETGHPGMCLAEYVERKFIPDHVARKTGSGRIHYHAILKHVLNPEKVEQMFAPCGGRSRTRLKALPDWPYLDDVRLCDVNAEHVRQLMSSASARGYSPQTVKHIKNVLGAVISHARKEGLFRGDNPVSKVSLPTIMQRSVHNLTLMEAKAVLRMMPHPEREVALVTITTGMNISEICALQWKHVNMTDSFLSSDGVAVPPHHVLIRRHRNETGVHELPFKRLRVVEVPLPLLRRFQRIRRGQFQNDPEDFVLSLKDGAPLCPGDIRTRLELIGRQLGIPWLSWQVLKRAHQSFLSELRVQLSDELILMAPIGFRIDRD